MNQEKILWAENRMPKSEDRQLPAMALEEVEKAREFHKSIPGYAPTPLARLEAMASYLGMCGYLAGCPGLE